METEEPQKSISPVKQAVIIVGVVLILGSGTVLFGLGTNHPEAADALVMLGNFSENRGAEGLAEPMLKRSVVIREKAFGRDHALVGTAQNELAKFYDRQGRFDDAEKTYRKSIETYENSEERSWPMQATGYNHLALLYHAEGMFEETEAAYENRLAITEKHCGKRVHLVANCLEEIADWYSAEGKFDKARSFRRRAVRIRNPGLASFDNPLPEVRRSIEEQIMQTKEAESTTPASDGTP